MTTISLQDFHFLRPEWLLALLPLALIVILLKQFRSRQSGWQSVIAPHLYRHMVSGRSGKRRAPPYWMLIMVWLLSVIALSGPTWERLPQPVFQIKNGQVILIDMSLSMRATDVAPDRLTRAKYKAIDLINGIGEGEMGLVAYAGDAFVISPLTTDASNLTTLLPSLSPEIMPTSGSAPYRGLETAAELLKNAGYQHGDIYWITDGVDMSQVKDLSGLIRDLPFSVNILGVGTDQGAPIRLQNGELLKDRRGQIVIPKLRSSQLAELADVGNGQFATLTPDETDIQSLIRFSALAANASETDETTDNDGDQWAELGPWLLLICLPFAAYGFRRGLLTIAIVALMPLILMPKADAQETSTPTVQEAPDPVVPWYKQPFLNSNQTGYEEYKAKQYDQAVGQFSDPAWKGAAAYKAGNYEAALHAYSKVNTVDGLYNQANALAQLGELDKAISRYDDVLQQAPDHTDAKANKALLEKLKQQHEQNQDQQNQNQNQQDQQQQDPQQGEGGESQSSDEQNGDNSNQQTQNNQDNQQSQGKQNADQDQSKQNAGQDNADEKAAEQQDESQSEDESDPRNNKQQPSSPTDNPDRDETSQQSVSQPGELSDEDKEKQQRLENLMRRIPDDPAYLLKRKMLLEAQKRNRQAPPSNRSEW